MIGEKHLIDNNMSLAILFNNDHYVYYAIIYNNSSLQNLVSSINA